MTIRRLRKTQAQKLLELFQLHGGALQLKEIMRQGIFPKTLYTLVEHDIIHKIRTGLFCLQEKKEKFESNFYTLQKKLNSGVLCLRSALYYHRLLEEKPIKMDITLPRGQKALRDLKDSVNFFFMQENYYQADIQQKRIEEWDMKIYSPEKSLIDVLRFRKKIGEKVAYEGLKNFYKGLTFNEGRLKHMAKEARVLHSLLQFLDKIKNEKEL